MVSRISSHSVLASCVALVQQAVVASPGSSYQTLVGMQPSTQQSNMGNQMQGMMVQYPPVQSYQVGGTKRGQRSEPTLRCEPVKADLLLSLCSEQLSVPQQSYQQPVLVSCQPGQGALAVAGVQPCYGLLPPNQHTTMR